MKKAFTHTSTVILALAALLATSCAKEMTGTNDSEGMAKFSLNFSVAPSEGVGTKAEAISDVEDAEVRRLDLYEYIGPSSICNHVYWEDENGLDLKSIVFTKYYSYGTQVCFALMANLDPDTAEYFAGIDGTELNSEDKCLIPLDAGNFNPHHPFMVGGHYEQFSPYYNVKDEKTVTIPLYRINSRIDIGKVAIGIDSLCNRNIKLKRIALIQTTNALKPFYGNCWFLYTDQCYLGKKSYKNNMFGQTYDGYNHTNNIDKLDDAKTGGTFNLEEYGATGKLAGDHPYFYNDNFGAADGTMTIDAPEDMYEATCHVFPEGTILNDSLDVNLRFYTYAMYHSSINLTNHDYHQKLVVEVEVDGQTRYFAHRVQYLALNTTYNIKKMSLAGLGSANCNYYVETKANDGYDGELAFEFY